MDNVIKVRTKFYHRIYLFLGTAGMGLAGFLLFFQGIKFESSYSLYYIFVSFIGIPYGVLTFLWSYRAYAKKGLLFSIMPGADGKVIYRKGSVNFSDIKEIKIIREFKLYKPRTMFFSDLTIRTTQNKTVKIPVYSILSIRDFRYNVENYILPYTTAEAQKNWEKKYKGPSIA